MTATAPFSVEELRAAIRHEYDEVASCPMKGFHFHTGRFLARRLGYPESWIQQVPDSVIESFAGVGNFYSWGPIPEGARAVDLGCGAGFDSLLAATMAGPDGKVVGIDMTESMVAKAQKNAETLSLGNAEFREGYLEELPVEDNWATHVISNGVINLVPEKDRALAEAFRVLEPGGTLQFSDILVSREVPDSARARIDLWTG
jgi:arsenite methyltransferase